MLMQKRAQAERMAVFVMITIVAGLILVIGFYGIRMIGENARSTQLESVASKLNSDFSSNTRYGSAGMVSYLLPPDVAEVCFVDVKDTVVPSVSLKASHPLIWNSVEEKNPDNMFFLSDSGEVIYADEISVYDQPALGYFCGLAIDGKIEFRVAGTGEGAMVDGTTTVVSDVIESDAQVLELSAVPGLRLEVPGDNSQRKVTFSVERESDSGNIYDKIDIGCLEEYNGNFGDCANGNLGFPVSGSSGGSGSPLKLYLPLAHGIKCVSGSYPKIDYNPTVGSPSDLTPVSCTTYGTKSVAVYEITQV